MPLNPDGIFYADTSTEMSIADITSAMATSIGDKLGGIEQTQTVNSQAERDLLYPTPVQGNTVFRNDLGFQQTYYNAWNAVSNPGGRGAINAWYDNQRNMGLVPVVPTTVAVSGGTATANSLGLITYTSATSISLNNVFSSTYDNYRIFINLYSTSATTDIILRVRAAGTDLSSSTYQYSKGSMLNNVYGADFQSSSTGINFARSGGTGGSLSTLDIAAPALSQYTKLVGMFAQGTSLWFGSLYANVGNTTSYDGFTVYPASGGVTFTGTIQVLGYNS